MPIPPDYLERVYAGVLGKLIGVYLGRPFEGWNYAAITARLGEINYYVHEKLNRPLIVTDDDISGTFTFLRALPDYDDRQDLTPAQIGQTWLNYLIEGRTVLWWGGLGTSTEHTAYLRLQSGIPAPRSGSMELNGRVVAEQIGAQIFIDGWAMISPGDPERAADFARRAASVSHAGEAIYGAQMIAAMEAQAFVEADSRKLIDTGLTLIPHTSIIYHLINDLLEWHAQEPDWRKSRERIAASYGYDQYGGGCHIVPNHALILLGLLYGEGDFQKSLRITNTSGWDTDCNSGNLGCLLGIKNGLRRLEAGPDWRGPVSDRLYLSSADGGRAITDAVNETYYIVNIGRRLAAQEPVVPKGNARFHFELPGSVQGFRLEESIEARDSATLENVLGHSQRGQRSLAIHYRHLASGRVARAATPTFIPPEAITLAGYELQASPTLYAGQTVRAGLAADPQNRLPLTAALYLQTYAHEQLVRTAGPQIILDPGQSSELQWHVPNVDSAPIAEIGIELSSPTEATGSIYLDYLTWEGAPDLVLKRPEVEGTFWERAWVKGIGEFRNWNANQPYHLIQNRGVGLLIQGTREWTDYRVTADVSPHLVAACGLAARVQGMRRYYAVLLAAGGQKARLIKVLDGEAILAEADFNWEFDGTYLLSLQVEGKHLQAWIDGKLIFDIEDDSHPLTGGAIALVCEEGSCLTKAVTIQPILEAESLREGLRID